MKILKKILCLSVFILIITILFSGCDIFRYTEHFECITGDDGNFTLIAEDGTKYYAVEFPRYFPDEVYSETIEDSFSKCKYGYVFRTSSEYCLYIENFRGGMPHFVYREDYDNELKMSGNNIDYARIQYDGEDDALDIKDSKIINKFINKYYHGEIITNSKIIDKYEIGTLLFFSNEYEGLVFSVRLYSDGENYYISNKGGAYITPDGVILVTDIINEIINKNEAKYI